MVKDHAEYEYLPAMALRGRTRSVQVYRVKSVGKLESGIRTQELRVSPQSGVRTESILRRPPSGG
jgi:hypothetical protein